MLPAFEKCCCGFVILRNAWLYRHYQVNYFDTYPCFSRNELATLLLFTGITSYFCKGAKRFEYFIPRT